MSWRDADEAEDEIPTAEKVAFAAEIRDSVLAGIAHDEARGVVLEPDEIELRDELLAERAREWVQDSPRDTRWVDEMTKRFSA